MRNRIKGFSDDNQTHDLSFMERVQDALYDALFQSYLGGGEEEPHPLHADLEQAALAALNVLDRELAPELHAGPPHPAHAPTGGPLHRPLDAVVQVPTLARVVFVKLSLTPVPSPQTQNLKVLVPLTTFFTSSPTLFFGL